MLAYTPMWDTYTSTCMLRWAGRQFSAMHNVSSVVTKHNISPMFASSCLVAKRIKAFFATRCVQTEPPFGGDLEL